MNTKKKKIRKKKWNEVVPKRFEQSRKSCDTSSKNRLLNKQIDK